MGNHDMIDRTGGGLRPGLRVSVNQVCVSINQVHVSL